ncbi:MAG: tetratricopeptide repeat protein [Rhizomicrobium sp.]
MHKLLLATAAAVTLVFLTAPSFSMGGGGGGSGGGGYSGGGFANTPAFDDYTVAVRLIKHQKYSDAIPHLEMALADKPHSADILNYLGYTHRMIGDYASSLAFYKRALAIDPDHKGVHEYLGELYLQMNDLTSAQAELTTLASLCPSGCDERDMLTKAIAASTPPAGAAPAAATTAPAAPTPAPATTAAPATTTAGQ